jgi:hypothetical protein
MGWSYILVNHTRKIIEYTSLVNVWHLMGYLIREQGWEAADDVEMMYEENNWTKIGKLVVNEGYKSPYGPMSFVHN